MMKLPIMRHQATRHCSLKQLLCLCLSLLLFLPSGLVYAGEKKGSASATQPQEDVSQPADGWEVDLRFLFTTDIHGQVLSQNFETAQEDVHGGLEKSLTMIETAREEADNSFTFDLGDNLYDYTTETIFDADESKLQPVFQALTKIGYDAMVLGNHDFDYGFNYVVSQLEDSGLKDKVVVSNLTYLKNGDYPFHENKIISRLVTSKEGAEIIVDIGVVGVTVPKLSTKTEILTGFLQTQDIVKSVQKQAAALKAKGADLVVVLAHSGMGEEEPVDLANNAAYALTKIPEVDIVLCGHEHNVFPDKDKSPEKYYALSGVDKETGLVNGKNLVMGGTRGDSIGVVDLTCKINNGKLQIVNRKSEVRYADKTIPSSPEITKNVYQDWLGLFEEHKTEQVAKIADDVKYQNYFGLLEDNNVMQLLNNAKRAYGLQFINTQGSAYADYPLIACSRYNYYGQADNNGAYVDLSGNITGSDMASLQIYQARVVVYKLTVAQLKEWMEWSASSYHTIGEDTEWLDSYLNACNELTGLDSLVAEDWLDSWAYYRVFDGVEYEIDPTIPPRYNAEGYKINDTRRIKSLTINGKALRDDQIILLASDLVSSASEANQAVVGNIVLGGYVNAQKNLTSYLKWLSLGGPIEVVADQNWKLKLPSGYSFLFEADKRGAAYLPKESWQLQQLMASGEKNYYIGSMVGQTIDNDPPSLVVTPNITVPTNRTVFLAVDANDHSGIKEIRYLQGKQAQSSTKWENAQKITKGFKVNANDVFTIRAEDNAGNFTTIVVMIDNINQNILQVPTMESYSNRNSSIRGTAEPGATVYIQAQKETYTAVVDQNGNFSYALPDQAFGTKLKVWVEDYRNRKSDVLTVTVKRTGPNRPVVSGISNRSGKLKGNLNDQNGLPVAEIGNKVYVSKGEGTSIYKNSEAFDAAKKIVETTVTIDKDGNFEITIPCQNDGAKVSVYTIDYLGRSSRRRTKTVVEKGPNRPKVIPVSVLETGFYVYVKPLASGAKEYRIDAAVNDKIFTATTDNEGYAYIETDTFLTTGTAIRIYAADEKDGEERRSMAASGTVRAEDAYYSAGSKIIKLDPITDNTAAISGTYKPEKEVQIIVRNRLYKVSCDADGRFTLDIGIPLLAGNSFTVLARDREDINGIVRVTVGVSKPETPLMMTQPAAGDTALTAFVPWSRCKVYMTIRGTVYEASAYLVGSEGYRYMVKIDSSMPLLEGETFEIYAENTAGRSDTYYGTVGPAAGGEDQTDGQQE